MDTGEARIGFQSGFVFGAGLVLTGGLIVSAAHHEVGGWRVGINGHDACEHGTDSRIIVCAQIGFAKHVEGGQIRGIELAGTFEKFFGFAIAVQGEKGEAGEVQRLEIRCLVAELRKQWPGAVILLGAEIGDCEVFGGGGITRCQPERALVERNGFGSLVFTGERNGEVIEDLIDSGCCASAWRKAVSADWLSPACKAREPSIRRLCTSDAWPREAGVN